MSELQTGTVTVLLAEVQSCELLCETAPYGMSIALPWLDITLCELIAVHDGVRPAMQGEPGGFVLAFNRASDAVACALALQRAPLAPIRLRIGLHTGEVELGENGTCIGSMMNRAARVRDLAYGGQTLLSGVTGGLVADSLPRDAWLTDLGMYKLRGVPRPERVVQLCHLDLPNAFPSLRILKLLTCSAFHQRSEWSA